MADATGHAEGTGGERALDEVERQLEALAIRLDRLVSGDVVRARAIELVDAKGRVRVRLAALAEEDRLGLELLRPDGSLCAALSDLGGEGSLVFVGGEHGTVVLEVGGGEHGARLVVVRPDDELGTEAIDLAPRFR